MNIYKRIYSDISSPKIREDIKKINVSAYQGCKNDCLYCPAIYGFIKKEALLSFEKKRYIYIIDNILEHLMYHSKGRDNLIANFSPVSDPFQEIEFFEQKNKEAIEYCIKNSITVSICTKNIIPDDIIEILKKNDKNIVQLTMVSISQEKKNFIVRGDRTLVSDQMKLLKKLDNNNIRTVVRIDPIFPYITDELHEIESLIKEVSNFKNLIGVLSSSADIVEDFLELEKDYLNSYKVGTYEKYRELFSEKINSRLHANTKYRENLFKNISDICIKHNVLFGITWEPYIDGKSMTQKYTSPELIEKLSIGTEVLL